MSNSKPGTTLEVVGTGNSLNLNELLIKSLVVFQFRISVFIK